jgi:hypothetical protein
MFNKLIFLQLISLDIKKAFYQIIHAVMIQALVTFGFPELLNQALKIILL